MRLRPPRNRARLRACDPRRGNHVFSQYSCTKPNISYRAFPSRLRSARGEPCVETREVGMSEEIKREAISRRKALSVVGLGAALVLLMPSALMSDAEAQETGTERRQERRTRRTERRQERRKGRAERREVRRKGRAERRQPPE